MSSRAAGWLFSAGFIVMLIAGLPLQVPLNLLAGSVPGVGYSSADGPWWGGTVTDLQVNAVRAGDLELAVSPLDFFLLRAGVSWQTEGTDLAGRGRAWQSLLGATGFNAQEIEVSAGAMIPWLPIFGTVQVTGLDVVMSRTGCQKAAGQITTDVLQRSQRTLNWQGPVLDGAVACSGSDLVLQLAGQDSALVLDARAAIRADGSFQQDISVQTEEAQVGLALMGFGFTLVDNAYRLRMIGRWRR